jgi:hypothetical protein
VTTGREDIAMEGTEFKPTPESGEDTKADTEAVKIAKGEDLEADGKKREHDRHQHFRDNVNNAVLIILWLLVACICLGVATFAWHILTPQCAHFLDDKQLEKLQTLLGTALLSSAFAGYANRRMSG